MDFRTPTQIFLGFLLAAMALSLLGLAADNVSFVDQQHNPMELHYVRWNQTASRPYSYWLKMEYTPSKFSMGTMHAMLAIGVICTLVGTGIAVSSWIMRNEKTSSTAVSIKQRGPPFHIKALIITTITFVISLAIAIYVWQNPMRFPINFQNSLPLPSPYSKASRGAAITYRAPFAYTPEFWNCELYPYVVHPQQSKRLQHLCREAGIAKYLMIPILLLETALLGCLIWTWQKARVATATEAPVEVKEVDEISIQSKD